MRAPSLPRTRATSTLRRRRVLLLAPLLIALSLLAAVSPLARAQASDRPVIIGYVFSPRQVIDPALIAADKLTHINYAFANIRDGKVVEGSERDAGNIAALTGLRKTHPRLRILVSVGGWTWSGGFSEAALTMESRQQFVASAVEFVRRYDLDGFDVDWEYPGLPGFGNTHRPEDKEHFTALMAELRAALDAEGAKSGRRYLLTFAAGASRDFLAHTEMAKVQASVDFVNLMTYDLRVAEADSVAGHHANLYPSPWDSDRKSVDGAVSDFLAAGVPASKLVVGVPFYGRSWTVTTPDRNGLYQVGGPPTTRIDASYTRLSTELVNKAGFVRFWDADARSPYLWNAEERIFITYEDPESLALKCAYIREKGLAGAMFWQYTDDGTGALLDALHRGLAPFR